MVRIELGNGSRVDEQPQELLGLCFRDANDLLGAAGFHRMWEDQHFQVLVATRPRRGLRQIGEHLRDNDHGWHAGAFALDRVVDTPRRARPSGAEADDRRIHCADEPGHLAAFLIGGADAHARIEEDDVAHAPARSCQRGNVVREMCE